MYAPEWSAQERPSALMRLTVWSRSSIAPPPSWTSTTIGIDLPAQGALSHFSIFAVYQPLRPELSSETKSARIFVNLSFASALVGVGLLRLQGSQRSFGPKDGFLKFRRSGMRTLQAVGSNSRFAFPSRKLTSSHPSLAGVLSFAAVFWYSSSRSVRVMLPFQTLMGSPVLWEKESTRSS